MCRATPGPSFRREDVDLDELKLDMDKLKHELKAGQGEADRLHFATVRLWTESFAVLGTLLMFMSPVWLLSSVLLAIATTARWTMVGHHTCHGGYNFLKEPKWNRWRFSLGPWRRAVDWFDWMLPEAWNVEHNNLHHYHLGETSDPDLVEENLAFLRGLQLPLVVKRALVVPVAMTWKWFYYAPNTYKQLLIRRGHRDGHDGDCPQTLANWVVWTPLFAERRLDWTLGLVREALGPYFVFKFLLYPLPWLVLGRFCGVGDAWFYNAIANVVVADVLANLYSFVIIVTNHAGDDLYRFDTHAAPNSGEFYLRAIISSVNYNAGTDAIDFVHGFLNYQIEHHCFPSLSMLSYQRAMPRVKALCKKHGIPYVQENALLRTWKTIEVMVGSASMLRLPKRRD